jgi:WD40 repeat protein
MAGENRFDKHLQKCTVRIESKNGSGTGFFIAPCLIVSCSHVVRHFKSQQLLVNISWPHKNSKYLADVIEYIDERSLDLAVLELKDKNRQPIELEHPCVSLEVYEPEIRDTLYSFGYPRNYPNGDSATFEYEGKSFRDEYSSLKLKLGQVDFGFSGAPLLNQKTGKVCGIVNISRNTNTDLGGRAIPISEVADALPELLERNIQFHIQAGNFQYIQSNHDWGEAPDISDFSGRDQELIQIKDWIINRKCRIVEIVGIGGIGKTSLAHKLSTDIQQEFEYIVWRTLRNTPSLTTILTEIIKLFSDQREYNISNDINKQLSTLFNIIQEKRCLIILDNVESTLKSGANTGTYQEEFASYGVLIRQFGEINHKSCLLLTSREKLKEVDLLESKDAKVQSIELQGLGKEASKIIKSKGLDGSSNEIHQLVEHYGGNPLALKIVSSSIKSLFGGHISSFLNEGVFVFNGIRDLLDQQRNRVSLIERKIITWLAINRELTSTEELLDDIIPTISKRELLENLESLTQRSLIESKSISQEGKVLFTLQPVIMEYVTELLKQIISEEVETGNVLLLNRYSLVKAYAPEHIRESQLRLLVHPIINRLLNTFGNPIWLKDRLEQIKIELQRGEFQIKAGYALGNILNFLVYLNIDLTRFDFSNTTIWNAFLQGVDLHYVDFSNSDLSKSAFTQTFSSILSIALSPDGEAFATGDAKGEIRLWSISEGQPSSIIQGHVSRIWSIAFSPDGKTLASCSDDRTIKIWDSKTAKCRKVLEEHNNWVWSTAFSPDGHHLISGGDDQVVRLWDVATGERTKIFRGHTNKILSVAFSPDGQTIASSSEDQTIRLWDINTGQCKKILQGHNGSIWSVAFSPDGITIASGGDDQVVRLWSVTTGQCLLVFSGHLSRIWSVTYSPNGQTVASSSEDSTVRLWNIEARQCQRILEGHSNLVWSIAFNKDGEKIFSCSDDQTIRFWSTITGQCERALRGHTSKVLSLTISPDGQTLASCSDDQTVRIWALHNGQCKRVLQGHSNRVRSVAFSPDGKTLASCSDDQTVRIWALHNGQCQRVLQGHKSRVRSVTFSPDGKTLASGCHDNTVRIWSTRTGQCQAILERHTHWVWSVSFSPIVSSNMLASCSDDQTIRLWDITTHQCYKTLRGHESRVLSVAFSPNGEMLASSSDDRTIRLWDVTTGQCQHILQGHTGWIWFVRFSFDGKMLASASEDGTIKLWNVYTGQYKKSLNGHAGKVLSVAFNLDNRSLVSGSEDETIRYWDIDSGECFMTLRAPRPYEGMNISGVTGLSDAQKVILKSLGAIESQEQALESFS